MKNTPRVILITFGVFFIIIEVLTTQRIYKMMMPAVTLTFIECLVPS